MRPVTGLAGLSTDWRQACAAPCAGESPCATLRRHAPPARHGLRVDGRGSTRLSSPPKCRARPASAVADEPCPRLSSTSGDQAELARAAWHVKRCRQRIQAVLRLTGVGIDVGFGLGPLWHAPASGLQRHPPQGAELLPPDLAIGARCPRVRGEPGSANPTTRADCTGEIVWCNGPALQPASNCVWHAMRAVSILHRQSSGGRHCILHIQPSLTTTCDVTCRELASSQARRV